MNVHLYSWDNTKNELSANYGWRIKKSGEAAQAHLSITRTICPGVFLRSLHSSRGSQRNRPPRTPARSPRAAWLRGRVQGAPTVMVKGSRVFPPRSTWQEPTVLKQCAEVYEIQPSFFFSYLIVYEQQTFLSHNSEGWDVQEQGTSGRGFWQEPTSSQTAVFSLTSPGRRWQGIAVGSFTKALILFMRVPLARANQLLRAPPPNTVTFWIRF